MTQDTERTRNWRRIWIVVLIVLAFSGPAGTYIQYRTSQAALHDSQSALDRARDALKRARANRQEVQFKLCEGQNQLRRANNRDHDTFKDAVRQQTHALQVITDPVLHGLVENGLKRSKLELRARPRLPLVACRKLVGVPKTR